MKNEVLDSIITKQDVKKLAAYFKNKKVSPDLIEYTINSLTLELDGENDRIVSEMLKQLPAVKQQELPDIIEGASPLIRCVNEKAKESLKALLMKGFKVNIRDDEGRTPLTQAVILNESEMLNILLDHSQNNDINSIGSYYATSALGIAFQNGNMDMIDLLLRHRADPQMIDPDNGYKPLTHLIPENLKNEISALIQKYS